MVREEQPVIQTSDLTKSFRQICALNKLNVSIYPGEVVALLGSNGSGKSTTFRLLLNIYRPSYGSVSLFGIPSAQFNGQDFNRLAYISESQKIPQWMTVESYVHYCSQFYSSWDTEYTEHLLKAFRLPKSQKIKNLSRGQKMKASFVSCLPAHPEILLLDEPFSGLDVETRAQLSGLLARLTREENLTVIITTHDVEEIEPIASRLLLLDEGKLAIDESFATFKGRYRKLFLTGAKFTEIHNPKLHAHKQAAPDSVDPERESLIISNYSETLMQELRAAVSDQAQIEDMPVSLREILADRSLEL